MCVGDWLGAGRAGGWAVKGHLGTGLRRGKVVVGGQVPAVLAKELGEVSGVDDSLPVLLRA